MITEEMRKADVMLDKKVEAAFNAWLEAYGAPLLSTWNAENEEERIFYLKNRLRRAFESGVDRGKGLAAEQLREALVSFMLPEEMGLGLKK